MPVIIIALVNNLGVTIMPRYYNFYKGENIMTDFNKLCKQAEELDMLTYSEVLREKSDKVLPVLKQINRNGLDGVTIFSSFIIGAIVADGKLSEEEYMLAYPMFRVFFGKSVNYDSSKQLIKSLRTEIKEFKKYLDLMVDTFGELSEELKDDIIYVCLLICAIDGKVSLSEKAWIKKLIR
jgi:hypothetical protein